MSRTSVALPYFPLPPADYSARYMHEVIRAFTVYLQQQNNPGPVRTSELQLTTATTNVDYGAFSWNEAEGTADLTMGDGVVQQIGMETYIRAKNNTGSTIPNGTVVGFAGVNGEIEIKKFIADGSEPELYFVGVTTHDMPDGDVGPVTVFGKVRSVDTSSFSVGNILYVSPSTAGALTATRPTAPNEVIVVAAVLVSDATAGEIMVRPTIPIGLDYGSFSSTAGQAIGSANTAQNVTFTTTDLANGVSLVSSSRLTVSQAGFYQATATFQVTSSNASSTNTYFWIAKNGTAVANTARIFTIKSNGDTKVVTLDYQLSLAASDYVEFVWAASATSITLDAVSGLSGTISGAPDVPSVRAYLTQIQL